MTWIDDTLNDYGRSLGLNELQFDDSGCVSLKFDVLGDLFMERLKSEVLIYVIREHNHVDAGMLSTALNATHWTRSPPFRTNAALYQDRGLLFSVTLDQTEFDVPAMERVIGYLGQLHDAAAEGSES